MSNVNIIRVLDRYNAKVIIDLNELKTAKRLEDANIFKTLFNLNEHSGFSQNFEMRKDKKGEFIILRDYDLSQKQWIEFINFVRTGRIKHMEKINKQDMNILIEHINELYMGVFGIFGPIPSFDRLCENIVKKYEEKHIKEEKIKYENPMTPEDDIYHKYYWVTGYNYPKNLIGNNFPPDTLWNVTVLVQTGDATTIYYRADRNNVETKITTTQTEE